MPAIDFPNAPSVNDTHTVGNRVWKWNGTVWEVVRSIGTAIYDTDQAVISMQVFG
jgi:hypothetical protein